MMKGDNGERTLGHNRSGKETMQGDQEMGKEYKDTIEKKGHFDQILKEYNETRKKWKIKRSNEGHKETFVRTQEQ